MFNGQKMRTLRKKKGLSMATLAEFIGISESYVSLIETGKRDCPDGKVLHLTCTNLDCQPSDLTDDKILLAFAESFARQADEPPKKPMASTIPPEEPTTPDTELIYLRSENELLRADINYLRETLAKCQENLSSALSGK